MGDGILLLLKLGVLLRDGVGLLLQLRGLRRDGLILFRGCALQLVNLVLIAGHITQILAIRLYRNAVRSSGAAIFDIDYFEPVSFRKAIFIAMDPNMLNRRLCPVDPLDLLQGGVLPLKDHRVLPIAEIIAGNGSRGHPVNGPVCSVK